jgi:hypothetical protein
MPYLDRRVVDFALSLPENLRSRPGCPKYFTRRAWAECFPAALLDAPEPADYTFQIVDALDAHGGAARLADLALTDLGWVDPDVIRRMSAELFSTARVSREHLSHAWPLWAILTMDEWYKRALSPSTPHPGLD